MSEHTKKHRINAHSHGALIYVTHRHITYAIPKSIASKYIVDEDKPKKIKKSSPTIKELTERLDRKFTKAGALLKGLRLREELSQVVFAKKIGVTQANLSAMENGRRAIGKIIAKRIDKIFGTNYRYFLE